MDFVPVQKGFAECFQGLDADIFCLQEMKCRGQIDFAPEGYHHTGIMQRRKAIPEQQFLLKRNLCR